MKDLTLYTVKVENQQERETRLLIFIVDKVIEIQLNGEYTATVSKGGIKVGCTTFPLSIVEALKKAVSEVTKK